MARGKYAARAANARAASARATAGELQAQLAAEREQHMREKASLNAAIGQLAGRLAAGVDELAREQVAAAHREANERVRRTQQDAAERGLAALKILNDAGVRLPAGTWPALYTALGVDPALDPATGGAPDATRRIRRAGRKGFAGAACELAAHTERGLLGAVVAARLTGEVE